MEPTDAQIKTAAEDLVKSIRDKGEIQHWTKALIRERLESQLKLPSGALKSRKLLVNSVVDEVLNDEEADDDKENHSPPSKAKTGKETKKGKGKASKTAESKGDAVQSDSELSVLDDEPSTSKGKATKKKKPAKKLATSETKARRADKNTDTFVSMLGLGPGSAGADEQAASMLMQGLTGGNDAMQSDSELSVLEDGPPKKKARPSNDGSTSKKRKSKKETDLSDEENPKKQKGRRDSKSKPSKKESKPLDKDEETIKRLKSFVIACGVRKQWAKEFDGMTKPSQQISHLKKILGDLGMTGRYSLEQAKAIRDKRELQQEIQDVITFDANINGSRPSRQKSRMRKVSLENADQETTAADEVDNDEDDDSPPPIRGKKRSRNSILAFLDDQSGSD